MIFRRIGSNPTSEIGSKVGSKILFSSLKFLRRSWSLSHSKTFWMFLFCQMFFQMFWIICFLNVLFAKCFESSSVPKHCFQSNLTKSIPPPCFSMFPGPQAVLNLNTNPSLQVPAAHFSPVPQRHYFSKVPFLQRFSFLHGGKHQTTNFKATNFIASPSL